MRRRRSAAARPADRRPGRTASRAQRRGRRRPRRSAQTNGRDDVRRIVGIDDDGAAPAARNRHADAGVAAPQPGDDAGNVGAHRRLLALRRPRFVIGAWAADRDAVDLHDVIAVLRPQRGDDVGECAVAHAGDGAPAPDAVVRRARLILHGSSFALVAAPVGAAHARRGAFAACGLRIAFPNLPQSPRPPNRPARGGPGVQGPPLPRRRAPRGDAAVHRGGAGAAVAVVAGRSGRSGGRRTHDDGERYPDRAGTSPGLHSSAARRGEIKRRRTHG